MFVAAHVVALGVVLSASPSVEARTGDFLSAESVEDNLQDAMGTALGMAASRLPDIVRALEPLFSVLPKNGFGRIERAMLRYVLHRHFQRQYNVAVRGLEPTQNLVGATALVTAEGIFRDRAPVFIQGVLEGRFFKKGFALEDAAAIAAVLEELVFEVSDVSLGTPLEYKRFWNRNELEAMLDGYVLRWMVSDNPNVVDLTQAEAEEVVPKWRTVQDFTRGEIDRLVYKRRQAGYGNAFRLNSFTAADFKDVVKSIASGFGAWWEQECQGIKKNLVSMDREKTGRVALSDFYHESVGGEWRFSESKAYLRELGALDETSLTKGPQVILPNYLLGASNCIGTSTYYHVCCVNECESLLGEVEQGLGGPVASPSDVFGAVLNATGEEDRGFLFGHLEQQLSRIAKVHKGLVPLHGRLFGQWMHRAFPRECPFPHRAGSIQSKHPLEFGENYLVTDEEIQQYTKIAKPHHSNSQELSASDNTWISELDMEDDELLTEYMEIENASLWGKALLALAGGTVQILAGAALVSLLAIAFQEHLHSDKDGLALNPQQKLFV